MNVFVLYLLLLKATLMSFSGLSSLPIVHKDLVVERHILNERQLSTAVAAGRMGPGPIGLYVVSVGYFAGGIPGAVAGWLAVITPAFLIIPMLRYLGARATDPHVRSAIQATTVASAGLIFSAIIPLGVDALRSPLTVAIAIASFMVLLFTRLDTFWVMAAAAAAGLLSLAI